MVKHLTIINPENATEDEVKGYAIREAARAIVLDIENNIALLYAANGDYYKLPGGGIEKNEDKEAALARESLEEVGCDISIIQELGELTEYRKLFSLKQISYCYITKAKGEKGNPTFTKEEQAEGFIVTWAPYGEAVQRISECNPQSLEAKLYMVPRDTCFLKEAKNLLNKI